MLTPSLLGFALSLAAPQGPAHQGLHPAEADLYLELNDVKGAMVALEKAPFVRFLRDEKVKGLLAKAGAPLDGPLAGLLAQALDQSSGELQAGEWLGGFGNLSVSLARRADGGEPFDLLMVADLGSPEQTAAFRNAISRLFETREPVEGSLPGLEHLRGGGEKAWEFWSVALGSRLVLGSHAHGPGDFQARAEGKLRALSAEESYSKRLAGLGPVKGTPLLWFSLARSMEELGNALGEMDWGDTVLKTVNQIPDFLNPFAHPGTARVVFADERIVTEMISVAPPDPQTKPVQSAWLEPVPAGAMFFFSSAFDGASAAKRLREILASDESRASALAAIEQRLGYGPERLLARLGPGMTFYSASPSGLGLPDSRLWIDCEDPAAFATEFETLVTAMGELLPGYQAKTKPYKVKVKGSEEKLEVPVTTLTLPPDAVQVPMISVSPSFAPVGKKLVFGFGSMDVKSELKRVHSGEGEPIVAGASPLAARGFTLPEGTESMVVMDWGKLLAGVVGMVQAFAGMASPEDMPFDPKQLPGLETFAQYFKPTFYFSKRIEGGLYRRNEASFGPETWLGLSAVVAAGIRGQSGFGGSAAPIAPADK
jgi:hypothetical protein